MKTIWFVYPYGPLPGEKSLDVRYIRFSRVLSKLGYKCIWWTANFSHASKEWRSDGWKTIKVDENITIELVPTSSYKSNISVKRAFFEMKFASNLGKRIKHIEKPDIIITPGTGMLTAFRPLWPYIKYTKVPVIFDIMDVHMFSSYMQEHHKALAPLAKLLTTIINKRERIFYDNVSAVTALGRGQLEIAKARTGKNNIPSCLVYNGIYVNDFRHKLYQNCTVQLPHKDASEIWCVYAGSLGPSYDIETVLKCAQICNSNGENKVKFIIAGSGQYAEQVKNESIVNPNVIFLGRLSPDQLIPVYQYCDIGFCTYASYSTVDMPDKFYDYCAAGLAIVNSLKGEVKDHICEKQLGEQYDAGNAKSLHDAVVEFLDIDYLNQCKKNAFDIGSEFDLENQIRGLKELIDEIAK